MTVIQIAPADRAKALAALYNGSKPQGMGILHYTPEDMTEDQAAELLSSSKGYFDYLKGRVMKIDLGGSTFLGLYDRDLGAGHGLRVLDAADVSYTLIGG